MYGLLSRSVPHHLAGHMLPRGRAGRGVLLPVRALLRLGQSQQDPRLDTEADTYRQNTQVGEIDTGRALGVFRLLSKSDF